MRASKARAGRRTGKVCHRRWSAYGKSQGNGRRNGSILRTGRDLQRLHWLAGVVGFELRNVGANYPFEKSLRFLGSSRILATETIRVLSCAVGIRSSGLVPGSRQACRQVRPTTRSRRRPGRPGRHRCRAAARHPRRPLSRSPPPQRLRGSAGRTWCRAGYLP
jgi:hypothetical protein